MTGLLDERVIELLSQDARQNSQTLAKQLNVSFSDLPHLKAIPVMTNPIYKLVVPWLVLATPTRHKWYNYLGANHTYGVYQSCWCGQ